MGKTNHQRGFTARPDSVSQIKPIADTIWPTLPGHQSYWTEALPLSGKQIQTHIHPDGGLHDSEEKCRRGAKRRINKLRRSYENAATRKLADDNEDPTLDC